MTSSDFSTTATTLLFSDLSTQPKLYPASFIPKVLKMKSAFEFNQRADSRANAEISSIVIQLQKQYTRSEYFVSSSQQKSSHSRYLYFNTRFPKELDSANTVHVSSLKTTETSNKFDNFDWDFNLDDGPTNPLKSEKIKKEQSNDDSKSDHEEDLEMLIEGEEDSDHSEFEIARFSDDDYDDDDSLAENGYE